MRFSVVIPTRNRADQVTLLVKQLLAQLYPKNDFEIIVIHNGTTDNTVSLIKRIDPELQHLRLDESIPGLSFARNRGYKLARFDHVVFLDDDTRIQPNFLSLLNRAWNQHPHAALLGGRIIPDPTILKRLPPNNASYQSLLHKYNWIYAYIDYGENPTRMRMNDLLCGALISVNKNMIPKQKQLFNTKFGKTYRNTYIGAEDYELCNRLMLEKKQVWYIPTVTSTHVFSLERFKKTYIIKRHLRAGAENFLMNTLLKEQYPSFAQYTFTHILWSSIKNFARGGDDYYLRQFKDPMFLVFSLSYITLGPLLYFLAKHGENELSHLTGR